MILWPCFICGSEMHCRHREPDLVLWVQERERARQVEAMYPPVPRPKPPARETAYDKFDIIRRAER
jgi:hypothetical protein